MAVIDSLSTMCSGLYRGVMNSSSIDSAATSFSSLLFGIESCDVPHAIDSSSVSTQARCNIFQTMRALLSSNAIDVFCHLFIPTHVSLHQFPPTMHILSISKLNLMDSNCTLYISLWKRHFSCTPHFLQGFRTTAFLP